MEDPLIATGAAKKKKWDKGKLPYTAVSASIAPVLACGHETLLEGPEEQGASGPWTSREEAARTFSVSVPTIKRCISSAARDRQGRCHAHPGRPRVKGVALEGAARAPCARTPTHAGGAPRAFERGEE